MTAPPALRCSVCQLIIDPVTAPVHPSCEPDPDAERIRREHAEWVNAGLPAGPTLPQVALGLIRSAAMRTALLDANTLRHAFDRAGIPGPLRGPAWARAVRAGVVEQVGYLASTGQKTNAHPIAQYRSLVYRTERTEAA